MIDNLTIIVPFFNGHEYIERLVRSIPQDIPIIIVDDQSDVPLQNLWESSNRLSEGKVEIIRLDRKGYFAGAVNRGLQESQTDVLVLNQDSWFDSPDFFSDIETLRREYAFFGERIRGIHPSFGELGYVHGTCMFISRDCIGKVGLLDEKNYPLWGNTAEYQWRVARKNLKILPIKEIKGFHHDRATGERYGESIKSLLKREPDNQSLLVRTPPILSVVVPCYNYGRYLMDCIASLIGGSSSLGEVPGQTLQSLEIVIVDDASMDDSLEYIKKAASLEKGIRAYHLEKNVGTARALNYGIERCYGKYITFLSADDMREPDSLEKLVQTCEQNPHSFAYDDVWLFYQHQKIKKWKMEEYDFDNLIWKNHVHAGIMFPKQAWSEVGGYPAIMNDGREDWAFNVALGIHGWCGVHLQNYGYLYRREGQNRTETNTTEAHRERFLGKIMSLFPEIYKGNRPMACCGKGSNSRKNVGITSKVSAPARSFAMTANLQAPVGSQGMELLEYTGGQMNFTITGDVTQAKYTFGKDRPRGWVDKRDVGDKDSRTGFLAKRDASGNSLYRIVTPEKPVEPQPVEVTEVTPEVTPSEGAAGAAEASGTLSTSPPEVVVDQLPTPTPVDAPNPSDMTVDEIRALVNQNLTRDQWELIYRAEMAGRNRKGAVAFIEELLASWQA